jgi:hypothetical protein
LLDLAGRAGSVIDHHALTKPQADNILLAPDMLLLGLRRRYKRQRADDQIWDVAATGHPISPS